MRTLAEESAQEKLVLEESESRLQQEREELAARVEQYRESQLQLTIRLEQTAQDLEQHRMVLDEERKRGQERDDEYRQQLEQMQAELERVRQQSEQESQELDQLRLVKEDIEERSRLKIEDLQQRIEQIRQESEANSIRLQQQKKFYDEERELRRQKELEILQLKKTIQDDNNALRQRDQQLAHEKKIYEDKAARWRSKEQVLSRRVEQLQQDWRALSTKLDQSQRDMSLQRKNVTTGATGPAAATPRAEPAAPTRRVLPPLADPAVALETRRMSTSPALDSEPGELRPTPSTEVKVRARRPLDEPASPRSVPRLSDLEDQAQKELQEWKSSRDQAAPLAEEPSKAKPDPKAEPKAEPKAGRSKFSPMPWLKLK